MSRAGRGGDGEEEGEQDGSSCGSLPAHMVEKDERARLEEEEDGPLCSRDGMLLLSNGSIFRWYFT